MESFDRDLVDLLTVTQDGEGRFSGDTEPYGVPDRLYGGHFIAQGLSAAFATVDEPKLCHSCHAYFHLKGDNNQPIDWQVEALREGRSFSSRRITARQHDDIVFSMSASFKSKDEDEFYQNPMPEVESPEATIERRKAEGVEAVSGPPSGGGRIEIHPITNSLKPEADFDPGEIRSTQIQHWLRPVQQRSLTQRQVQLLLAFSSDGPLPFCSVIHHGEPFGTHQHMSLDHCVWFHQSADLFNWVLFDATSVGTADGRGLNDASLFSRDGKLLASIRQESLMRKMS